MEVKMEELESKIRDILKNNAKRIEIGTESFEAININGTVKQLKDLFMSQKVDTPCDTKAIKEEANGFEYKDTTYIKLETAQEYTRKAVEEAIRGFVEFVDERLSFVGYMDTEIKGTTMPMLRRWAEEYLSKLESEGND